MQFKKEETSLLESANFKINDSFSMDEHKKPGGCLTSLQFHKRQLEIALQFLEENTKKPGGCFEWTF